MRTRATTDGSQQAPTAPSTGLGLEPIRRRPPPTSPHAALYAEDRQTTCIWYDGAWRSANGPHWNQLWPRMTNFIHTHLATVEHEFSQVTATFRD